MENMANLYLLVFPEIKAIKVGMSEDIHGRVQQLQKWWGEADLKSSYYLSMHSKKAFKLEKGLHGFLDEYALSYNMGIGKSELFSQKALDAALKYIDVYLSNHNDKNYCLKKGIPETVLKGEPSVSKYNKKIERATFNNCKYFELVYKTAEKFRRINRFIFYLYKKQNKIQYEYEIIDDYIIFRFTSTLKHDDHGLISGKIRRLFIFDSNRISRIYGVNLCNSIKFSDNVLHLKLKLPHMKKNNFFNTMLRHMLEHSVKNLKLLPSRSPAAVFENQRDGQQ